MHMHMHMHTSWQDMTWIFLKEWKIFLGVIVFFPHLKIKTSLKSANSSCFPLSFNFLQRVFKTFQNILDQLKTYFSA